MKNWSYNNFTVHQFEKLGSTNVEAMKMASSGQIHDHEIIMADEQDAGKGRSERVWSSPKGNLYFSLVLQPKVSVANVAQISFVGIVALRQAIEELGPEGTFKKSEVTRGVATDAKNNMVQNKWPNDLLINEKKVAGLLLESKNNQQNCELIILGIGVNIDSHPDSTIFPASNLKELGIEITPEILLQKFLDKFDALYQNWLNFGFTNIRNAWLSKAYHLKEKISVREGENKIEGIFEDMDNDGSLILKIGDETKKITAADIF